MKRADVVKHVQVEWKERVFDSEEHYVAAIKKSCATLEARHIDSFFKVQNL